MVEWGRLTEWWENRDLCNVRKGANGVVSENVLRWYENSLVKRIHESVVIEERWEDQGGGGWIMYGTVWEKGV